MTETTTLTLTEFLLARITEDEDTARRAREENPDLSWEASQIYDGVYSVDLGPSTHPDADSNYAVDMGVDLRMPREMAAHIEQQKPARVLADREAKRRIVEMALSVIASFGDWDAAEAMRLGGVKLWDDVTRRERGHAHELLEELAMPYADHPDYNPDWN